MRTCGSLAICLPVCPTCPHHLSVCLSIYLSTCLSIDLPVYLSVFLPIHPPIYLSICLTKPYYLSIHQSTNGHTCVRVYTSISLLSHPEYLSVKLSDYFSVCPRPALHLPVAKSNQQKTRLPCAATVCERVGNTLVIKGTTKTCEPSWH